MFCPSVIDLAVGLAAPSGRIIERAQSAMPFECAGRASALPVAQRSMIEAMTDRRAQPEAGR
jgi:hypothetical protein